MLRSPPRAILFDLDDTLIETGQRPAVLRRIAEEFAAAIAPTTPDDLARRLESAFGAYWADPGRHKAGRFAIAEARRTIVAEAFAQARAPALTPELAHRFADRFTAWREEMTRLFPGAIETLTALRARVVRLALVTNGPSATQRAKIERFALAPFFQHIQIEGELGFGKPEDQAYLHAMETLGVRPDQTWMIGDNLEWEVAAPQRLGIHAIWFDGFSRGLPQDATIRPDRIIQTHHQLLV